MSGRVVRHLLKFLHSIGAIGIIGSMAALLVLLALVPPPESLEKYAAIRGAMASIATWIFYPSLGLMLVAGLLSMACVRAFQNAGWAWAKAATGILVFESGFAGVLGPIQREAERSAQALAGTIDPVTLAVSTTAERNTLWILLGVCITSVILGIWRPRLSWRAR